MKMTLKKTGALLLAAGLAVSSTAPAMAKDKEEQIATGLKKFGAMLGDYVEVGCNSVLNPGTVIGCHTNIYPVSCVRGVVPAHSIFKRADAIVSKEER